MTGHSEVYISRGWIRKRLSGLGKTSGAGQSQVLMRMTGVRRFPSDKEGYAVREPTIRRFCSWEVAIKFVFVVSIIKGPTILPLVRVTISSIELGR